MALSHQQGRLLNKGSQLLEKLRNPKLDQDELLHGVGHIHMLPPSPSYPPREKLLNDIFIYMYTLPAKVSPSLAIIFLSKDAKFCRHVS
jgi:hypothetical protein